MVQEMTNAHLNTWGTFQVDHLSWRLSKTVIDVIVSSEALASKEVTLKNIMG
jgi:hypothetical protein